MLLVHDLHSGYGSGTVLHGLSLQVRTGQALAVLGRNGVGKTTLLSTLMGLVRPRRGSIRLDGCELAGRRPDQVSRAGIALVPQGRRIWPTVTVHEHVRLAVRGQSWPIQRLYELFPNLAHRRHQPAGNLSGGEQQMLAICRALATGPSLILLDEPSEGLAPGIVSHLATAITEMVQSGLSVVIVEHDLRLAYAVASDVAVMVRGTVVHTAAVDEFRNDHRRAHQLLGLEA
ncbi:ABC transporter ATP-binding protein [Rhizocola hellebori]|uniref:ABC transporter ATP-binding protein n=1 Tax=Rhizocola hellebori TaxID=1392758 RepID=A0A8J3VGR1_9ACTN|nr:ABC transporter ATP-binding protein [Rhizocola hellebori]GIH05158.1 ABC transporter ATP-binding protein [Rhizocola hellebori]